MSDYTPTLGESESRYSAGRLLLDGERDAGTATERYEEFYRMIAEVERAAAARALEEFGASEHREAARIMESMPDPLSGLAKERSQKRSESYERSRSATRALARAAEIREGKNDD